MQQLVPTRLDADCMWQTHGMKVCCCYGLLRHLNTELLTATLVHHVGTANRSAGGLTPDVPLLFALILQIAGAK